MHPQMSEEESDDLRRLAEARARDRQAQFQRLTAATEYLHQAYNNLIDATEQLRIADARLGFVNPPVSHVLGGLADAVMAVSDMVEEMRDG